jgi:hypothetical protein
MITSCRGKVTGIVFEMDIHSTPTHVIPQKTSLIYGGHNVSTSHFLLHESGKYNFIRRTTQDFVRSEDLPMIIMKSTYVFWDVMHVVW